MQNLKTQRAKKSFQAKFYGKDNKKIDIHSEDEVNKIVNDVEKAKYIVEEVKRGEKRTPAPPFTTSTMQQEASRKLSFSIKKTMTIAQGLYEGVKNTRKRAQ